LEHILHHLIVIFQPVGIVSNLGHSNYELIIAHLTHIAVFYFTWTCYNTYQIPLFATKFSWEVRRQKIEALMFI